jgi:hypothetical protein
MIYSPLRIPRHTRRAYQCLASPLYLSYRLLLFADMLDLKNPIMLKLGPGQGSLLPTNRNVCSGPCCRGQDFTPSHVASVGPWTCLTAYLVGARLRSGPFEVGWGGQVPRVRQGVWKPYVPYHFACARRNVRCVSWTLICPNVRRVCLSGMDTRVLML